MEFRITQKSSKFKVPVGIWKNGKKFELAWLTKTEKICSVTIPEKKVHKIPNIVLKETLRADGITSGQVNNLYEFSYISALPPHLIWSKSVILAGNPTALECERFCEFTLEREIPFPIDDVHFDYRKTPLGQQNEPSSQLDIFAVHKKTAEDYIESLQPLRIEVLDHSAYCLLRCIDIIAPERKNTNTLWIYLDHSGFILIRERYGQLQVMQQAEIGDLIELKNKFVARYGDEPEHCIAMNCDNFRHIIKPDFMDYQLMSVPFIAFGCALWGEGQKLLNDLEITIKPIEIELTLADESDNPNHYGEKHDAQVLH
ncbi:type IV pilus assembly PilM-like protein [Cricetibacter osteomyelitidis]|uniref:Type IV pilus assembly PilM-like protein n=1 Tax=Cricetibacter osteomyelitidis TaxID=1521931 RepID=A0A4R2T6F6_9PAST|nr:pilus assembly protein PilM [Cricetibacter osteomyelitidis]TCP97695.1 type IV pilus assembly PilM-like protein [Cricetibacter osteomyelitidis]